MIIKSIDVSGSRSSSLHENSKQEPSENAVKEVSDSAKDSISSDSSSSLSPVIQENIIADESPSANVAVNTSDVFA